jgi:hypothetical protein
VASRATETAASGSLTGAGTTAVIAWAVPGDDNASAKGKSHYSGEDTNDSAKLWRYIFHIGLIFLSFHNFATLLIFL